MGPPRLRHLHLPGLTPYHHASRLQSFLVSQFLTYKKSDLPHVTTPPVPTIITFSPPPIYTTGRRELNTYTPLQQKILTQPLDGVTAEFTEAQRGGQITFHGPGQLVAYPILSLSKPATFGSPIRPRDYVNLLEETTIQTLHKYGIRGLRTENPGVWYGGLLGKEDERKEEQERKLAALGVHLRRNVTSNGVGLNVTTDLRWFERIVACGLEGKGVTSMAAVRGGLSGLGVGEVAREWVGNFAELVSVRKEFVERIGEEEVLIPRDG